MVRCVHVEERAVGLNNFCAFNYSFPAAMSKALDLHDKLARSLLKQFHGHEVIFIWLNSCTSKSVQSDKHEQEVQSTVVASMAIYVFEDMMNMLFGCS